MWSVLGGIAIVICPVFSYWLGAKFAMKRHLKP